MIGNLLNFSDPSKNSYYFPFIIIIIIILFLFQIIKDYFFKKVQNLIDSFDIELEPNESYDFSIVTRKESLRIRYLIAFIITRCAMWAKAPYLYYLFMIVHKFSFVEIGFLFLIREIGGLFFGTIIYKLALKSRRKLLCHIFNFITIINVLLLIQGSRILAYLAIIISSGFGAGFISSTFEAWLLTESEMIFHNYPNVKQRFLKRTLKKSYIYDAINSIITCFICSFIYTKFGIIAPFWINIFLSLLSSIVIEYLWDENIRLGLEEALDYNRLYRAMHIIKKLDVLCIGLIEGLVKACFFIYVFSWTPILKLSTYGPINVGFIFTIMLSAMMIGLNFYEIFFIYLRFDYHISIIAFLFLLGLVLFLIYYINSFLSRLIFLSVCNGLFGFYNPLIYLIKSEMFSERYRATIKFLFSIPTNVYIIIIFLHLNYMNCFTLYLISSIICLIAFIIGIILNIFIKITNNNEENNEHEGYNYIL